MGTMELNKKLSRLDRKNAKRSFEALSAALERLDSSELEIRIEETGEKIKVPSSALNLLSNILQTMGEGKINFVVQVADEMTTQAAADVLGCSRPHLVKLLEEGKIPFRKVGKHRRIKYADIMDYREEMKRGQKQHLIDMMNADEDAGLYDD